MAVIIAALKLRYSSCLVGSRNSSVQVEAVGKISVGLWRKTRVGCLMKPSGGILSAPVKKISTSVSATGHLSSVSRVPSACE